MQIGTTSSNSATLWPIVGVKAQYTSNPDSFAFGDADPDCDTEMTVMDNDGFESVPGKSGSFVAGGFTQSKKMTSAQYAAEALLKDPHLKMP